MNFAKWVYTIAGIYGLGVLLPLYFIRPSFAAGMPLEIYYFGFVGIGVAWQVAFLTIARDPVRYRPLMIAAIIEKAAFVCTALLLNLRGEIQMEPFEFSMVDGILGVLFVAAWFTSATGGAGQEK